MNWGNFWYHKAAAANLIEFNALIRENKKCEGQIDKAREREICGNIHRGWFNQNSVKLSSIKLDILEANQISEMDVSIRWFFSSNLWEITEYPVNDLFIKCSSLCINISLYLFNVFTQQR